MAICRELEELIPAYVLDAVNEDERVRIEMHLPHCADCRLLLAEYQPVAEMLPFAARPVEPPAELRYRILTATQSPIANRQAPTIKSQSPVSNLQSLISNLFRAPALSAAALLVVLLLALWNLKVQDQTMAELARQREFLTAIAYADGPPRHLQGTEVASRAAGRLYGGYGETTFVVVTYDLPKLASDQVYQLWLIDPKGERTSGGTFTVDERGIGWLFARSVKPLKDYQAVGVTVEPRGGSLKPTGNKMLGGDLH